MNRISKCMLAAAVLAVAADGLAQDQMQSPTIHPNRGQSAAQQARDADRCQVMARKRTGVDPTVLAENSTPLQEGKGLTITPIDQPTMALSESGVGTAGTQPGQAGQMGSSGAGATGSGGQMGTSEAGAMGASGSSGTAGTTGASATGAQPAGGTTASGTSGTAGSTGAMGPSGSKGAGHPAGSRRGKQLAMVTADDFNNAFAKCMASRGYTVERSSSGGN